MKTTTAPPGTGPTSRPCQCTWDIQPRSAPIRIPPRSVECSLHQQIQGEPQQPMYRYNRVPVLM